MLSEQKTFNSVRVTSISTFEIDANHQKLLYSAVFQHQIQFLIDKRNEWKMKTQTI